MSDQFQRITYCEIHVNGKVVGPKIGEPWRQVTLAELEEACRPAWRVALSKFWKRVTT